MRFSLTILVLAHLLAVPAAAEPRPDVGPEAERAWQQDLLASPDRLDVRWRLLRAIYYRGDFAARGEEEEDAAWSEGRSIAEDGLRLLTETGDGRVPHQLAREHQRAWVDGVGLAKSDVARFYFWSSIHLGAWSRSAGLLASVREGTANRMYAFLQVSLELEPGYDRGGPHRMLSALHATLPRVPFITGWVDSTQAIPEAERALRIAPDDPGNRFLWADTVLALRGRSTEVDAIFQEVANLRPRPGFEQEDAAIRDAAIARLEAQESA